MNPSSDAAASIWCVSTLSSNGIMSLGRVSETCWKYLVLADIPGSSRINDGAQLSSCPSLNRRENKACTSIIVPRPLVNASQCGPIRVIPWRIYLYLLGLTLLCFQECVLRTETMDNLVTLTEKLVVDPNLPRYPVHGQQPLQFRSHLPYPSLVSSILGAGHQLQTVDSQTTLYNNLKMHIDSLNTDTYLEQVNKLFSFICGSYRRLMFSCKCIF